MDTIKAKKLGLSYQVQELAMKNEKNQRIVYRANRTNKITAKLKKSVKVKDRKIHILTHNLKAMRTELETLCLHIYKMDSMLVTTTTSMEKILKVIGKTKFYILYTHNL